jgi:acetyl-CoA C-acetyltransferase
VRPVYVRGSAVSVGWADRSRSLTDLIFDCVRAALGDADVTAADLGAVVLAAHDLVDGRGLTSMVTAQAAAAYLKDETRLAEDGATAFVLGDARVRSGSVDTCLVAGWGRASEMPVDDVSHALFEPFTTRPLAMTEIAVSGMRAALSLATYPDYDRHRAALAARRPDRPPARTPGAAWPLRTEELPVWSDVVAAVVLTSTPTPVRVLGVGMSTEPFEIGDRDLLAMPALRAAGRQALATAGHAIGDVDVIELDGLTAFDEALAAEAVGAAGQGAGMALLAEADRLNPDGGGAAGYCDPAMGLVRICRARERLLRGGQLALATGSSVVAAQTQAAVVLGKETA